ncbi:ArsR/SmtB family transcription factor [Natronomonas sp. EA1]|uniref:ArsR/SmtB family transcription factor n=1 Tax=Natronomonas sp. EA1 TaxID=3421655 RepID=UPI003EB83D62
MGLLPSRLVVNSAPAEPKVLDIDGEEADRAFEALGSETARRILQVIYDEPRTPPEVQSVVGTSLQNVHYHLDRLEGANLIEPAGVGYSEKGNEMTVYGPASEAVVLFAGQEHTGSRLRSIVSRVFVLVAVLVGATGIVELLTPEPATPTMGLAQQESVSAGDMAASTASTASSLDPTLVFFLGGAFVIALLTAWWLWNAR